MRHVTWTLVGLLVCGGLARAEQVDLAAEVQRTVAQVRDPQAFRADNAAALMRARFDELLRLAPEQLDLAALERDPHGLVQSLFGLMLALDERLAGFHERGQLSEDIADAKRRALRGIRYLREQVLLRTDPARRYEQGRPRLAEAFPRQHWTVAPGFEGKGPRELPRTFAILCVGGSSVSAGIARSAAEDNMFSHFALGYRSTREEQVRGKRYPAGTPFVVEALIETGVIIHPLEEHYRKTVRDVIFILRDASRQDALDAAMDAFFARARDAYNQDRALPYDFSMGSSTGLADALQAGTLEAGATGTPSAPAATAPAPAPAPKIGDLEAYFCSGVGAAVFGAAGIRLFTTMSHLEQGPGTRRLFESWGIDIHRVTPAPGDADVSGVLMRVAEGVVVEGLEQTHAMHVVLGEMYRWMDEEGWQLRMPWYGLAATGIIGKWNDGPLDLGLVPHGITTDILRTMGPMDKAANHLMKRLLEENGQFRAQRGRSMTPQEMAVRLREVRDDTDGVRRWFRPAPRAIGRYALRDASGGGRAIELTVAHGHGLHFRVERLERNDQGQLVARATGSATQQDESLHVEWSSHQGSAPEVTIYRLQEHDAIRGDEPGHVGIERGRRVE